jgi:hypothetical protein
MKFNTKQATKSKIVLRNLETNTMLWEELDDNQLKVIFGGYLTQEQKERLARIIAQADGIIALERATVAAATVGLISPIDPIATTIGVTVGQTPGLTNR